MIYYLRRTTSPEKNRVGCACTSMYRCNSSVVARAFTIGRTHGVAPPRNGRGTSGCRRRCTGAHLNWTANAILYSHLRNNTYAFATAAHGGPVLPTWRPPKTASVHNSAAAGREAHRTDVREKRPADKLRGVNEPARGGVYPTRERSALPHGPIALNRAIPVIMR